MTELKRPEPIRWNPQHYWTCEVNDFLLACASELKRARKLREEANQLTSYHEGHEFVVEDLRKQGYFELIKKALEIENEVIQALRGSKAVTVKFEIEKIEGSPIDYLKKKYLKGDEK